MDWIKRLLSKGRVDAYNLYIGIYIHYKTVIFVIYLSETFINKPLFPIIIKSPPILNCS